MSDKSLDHGVLLRPSDLPSADRGGGARTIPLVTRKTGTKQLLNGITIIGPGSQIPMHSHNCEESVIVLEGHPIAVINGENFDLQPQDTTWIPPNLPHHFKNPSKDETVKIFWTYASLDATRTLVETGETRSVDSEHKNAQ
ncbi:cupin [Terrihabitans soli]|uniref:Cupin n=1 Tax=Terrihabitans soli TaxID=708113 RepID=A0A6S6QKY9_9HYPH|nr:cupin domain-containing protein [Terrihabitans soli]BCJ89946.1 cupin [Terrihabitans soli]